MLSKRKNIFVRLLWIVFSGIFLLSFNKEVKAESIKDKNKEIFKQAADVVERANLAAFYAGKDGRAEARMKITDSQGRSQIRQFTILRYNHKPAGKQDLMVFFSRPSDVKGTVFRVIRYPGKDDDRWLYLPGLDLVKRISAGDQRTSFVGSDFFYEDVSGRDVEADIHKIIKETEDSYVLKSTPKQPDKVEFSFYTSWIDKKTFLPMKVEYTRSDKLYRRMEVKKIKIIQGFPTVMHAEIENIEQGSKTIMQMRGVSYDLGVPASVFSERSLRKPPLRWTKGR